MLRANAEWLRSTKLTAEEALGKNVLDLFPQTPNLAAAINACVQTGEMVEVPRYPQRLAGQETWWEGTVSAVPLAEGTISCTYSESHRALVCSVQVCYNRQGFNNSC